MQLNPPQPIIQSINDLYPVKLAHAQFGVERHAECNAGARPCAFLFYIATSAQKRKSSFAQSNPNKSQSLHDTP